MARKSLPVSLAKLGLGAEATEDEIKAAYKRLAKDAHPDRGGSVDQFNDLREAYEAAKLEVEHGQSLSRARMQVDALRTAARGTLCPRCDGSGISASRKVGFRTLNTTCRLCRGKGRI